MVKLLSIAANLLEHHGLFEYISPFRLRKQPCSTRSRWVFESYAWVFAFFMIEHRSLPVVRFQETRVIQIFCSRFCERALIRSPPGNHLCPTFFFPTGGYSTQRSFWAESRAELNQCDPDLFVRVLRSGMEGNSLAFYLPSSIGLLQLNFRNAITLELHERACWPEFPLNREGAHPRALKRFSPFSVFCLPCSPTFTLRHNPLYIKKKTPSQNRTVLHLHDHLHAHTTVHKKAPKCRSPR